MRKVGLLELAHHNEVLRSYLIILLHKDLEISLFTNEWIFNQFYDLYKNAKIQWILRKLHQSSENFLEAVSNDIQNQDLLIQNTMEDGKVITSRSTVTTVLVVHDEPT